MKHESRLKRTIHVGDLAGQSTIKRRRVERSENSRVVAREEEEHVREEDKMNIGKECETWQNDYDAKDESDDDKIDSDGSDEIDSMESTDSEEEDSEDEESVVSTSSASHAHQANSESTNDYEHVNIKQQLLERHTEYADTNVSIAKEKANLSSQLLGNKLTTDVTSKYNVDVLFQRPEWRQRCTNKEAKATGTNNNNNNKVDWQRATNDKQKSVMFSKFMSDYFE